MKIEMWSDFVCPFCYLGKKHLELALEQFAHRDEVEVIYRSFELNPDVEPNKNNTIYEHLAELKGISAERSKEMHRDIASRGELVDIKYNFDTLIPANTLKAHRLSHYAASLGKQNELVELIFKAYFTDSLDIEDNDVLVKLASKVGLDDKEVLAVLNSDNYENYVREDQLESRLIGVESVPYFLINDEHVINGSQPVFVFLNLLNNVYDNSSKN